MHNDPHRFYDGFQWAVLSDFASSLGTCCFERGDLFYDTRLAYRDKWAEAKPHVGHSLQVLHASGTIQGDTDSCFHANWQAPVTLTHTDYKTGRVREHESTQGRLYSLLWKGDWRVLTAESAPPVPPLLMELSPLLENTKAYFHARLASGMKKPNVFVMPYDPCNATSRDKYTNVKQTLESEFVMNCSVENPFNVVGVEFAPTVSIAAFAVDSGAPERIRDVLKTVLYKPVGSTASLRSNFRLRAHGAFFPSIERKFEDLITHSFAHGDGHFYRYRLMKPRLTACPEPLREFLELVLTDCPNHFFKASARASRTESMRIELNRVRSHDVLRFANECYGSEHYKSAHENLQMHLLNHDARTICAELPLWVEATELENAAFFGAHSVLTGHVDVLRIESDGKIGIWDYKPNAFRETCAAAQVFLYATMLSRRTGLPLERFHCGYFDESDVFEFSPAQVQIR